MMNECVILQLHKDGVFVVYRGVHCQQTINFKKSKKKKMKMEIMSKTLPKSPSSKLAYYINY